MKIMVSAARSARRVIITVVAVLVMGSMLVGALASLTRAVSAGAASNALTITPSSLTVNGSQTGMASVNATGSSSLSLSFSYDASKLEPGDSLTYGWRNGTTGVDNKLGQIDGQTNTSGQPGVNEVGSKTVSLPATAQTADLVLYFTNSGQNGISDSITISSLALSGSQVDTNNNNQPVDYANVYVSSGGDDQNDGVSADKPFATIQHALDTVAANGTVHVANGTYGGTMQFKKSGVTLIGDSKEGVVLQPESSDGQAGVYATGVNNVTLQNVTVKPGASLTAGSLVKFTGGTGGKITNVNIKATTANNVTGIDINSFADVFLNNVYVNGVGKDGISVSANFQGTSPYTSNNISFNYVSVANAAWSGIAFYTTESNNVTPTESISGITFNNVSTQYNRLGIYLEGISGKTITSKDNAPLDLGNIKLADSTQAYIVNAQTADILANGAQFNNGQGHYNGVNDLTASQWATVKGLIVDQTNNNGGNTLGAVKFYNLNAPTNLAPADGSYTNDPNFADTWNATAPSNGGYDYQTANTRGMVIYSDSFNDNNWGMGNHSGRYSTANGIVTRLNSKTPEGVYSWSVRTVAPDGEKSDWSTPRKVTVDTTKPTINSVKTADGKDVANATLNNGSQTFTVNLAETNPSYTYIELNRGTNHQWLTDNTKAANSTENGLNPNLTVNISDIAKQYGDGLYSLKIDATDKAGNLTKQIVPFSIKLTCGSASYPKYGELQSPFTDFEKAFPDNFGLSDHSCEFGQGSTQNQAYNDPRALWHGQAGLQWNLVYNKAGGPTSNGQAESNNVVLVRTFTSGQPMPIATADDLDVKAGDEQTFKVQLVPVSSSFNPVVGQPYPADAAYTRAWAETTIDRKAPTINSNAPTSINPTEIKITTTDPPASSGIAKTVGNVYAYNPANKNAHADGYYLYKSHQSLSDTLDVNLMGLPDGRYYVKYNAVDNSGNPSITKKFDFAVDHTTPTVKISSTTATTISGTIDDSSAATVEVYVDGAASGAATISSDNNTWSWSPTSSLSSGDHTVAVIATDAAGNASSSEVPASGDAYQTFTVASDTQPQGGGSSNGSATAPSNVSGSPAPQRAVASLVQTLAAPVATIARALTPAIAAGITAGATPAVATSATPNSTVAATTDPTQAGQDNQGSVLGAQTTKPNDENNSTRSIKTNNGLAWYWWWVIVAAAVAAAWWIIVAVRRRRQQAEDDVTA